MESTLPPDNKDIILDVTLFAENLAEVSCLKAKVLAFYLFPSIAVLSLQTTLGKTKRKELHENEIYWSMRILLFGLVSTSNVHVLLYGNEI